MVKKYIGEFDRLGKTKISKIFKKKRQIVYYRVMKEFVPVSVETEFILNDNMDYPKKLEFSYNEKNRKWEADFIEEIIGRENNGKRNKKVQKKGKNFS